MELNDAGMTVIGWMAKGMGYPDTQGGMRPTCRSTGACMEPDNARSLARGLSERMCCDARRRGIG